MLDLSLIDELVVKVAAGDRSRVYVQTLPLYFHWALVRDSKTWTCDACVTGKVLDWKGGKPRLRVLT